LRFGVWGLGFGVWGLGLGVWGLGFGVWGLGFGVWVWGLTVAPVQLLRHNPCFMVLSSESSPDTAV